MIPKRTRKTPWVLISFSLLTAIALVNALQMKFGDRVIVAPTNSAAAGVSGALDPDELPGSSTSRPLPVWPPPSAETPADPAANPMSGALPTRIDWPSTLPGPLDAGAKAH